MNLLIALCEKDYGGPIPHNLAKTFDGPPTLERSGSEHRRAVTSFLLMVKGKAWFRIKDPPAGEGQVGQIQHCRAVTPTANYFPSNFQQQYH